MPYFRSNELFLKWKHSATARTEIHLCGKKHFERSRERDVKIEEWLRSGCMS